jgi:hypothetical protein
MKEDRSTSGRDRARDAAESALHEDLRALHAASLRDLPTIEQTARLSYQVRAGGHPGGFLMSSFRFLRSRPWPATALAAAAIAAALLLIPVSYQKTVGHDVTLTLAAPGLDTGQIQKIASELRSALRAATLSVRQEEGSGPVLTARVSGRSGTAVARVAEAFAHELTTRGIAASARITPRTERVLGNVYAFARDNIIEIRVSSEGKTPEQVEAEIKDQLEAAGIENPTVEYSRDGNQQTLKVQVTKTAADGEDTTSTPEFHISVDGHEPGPNDKRCDVRVRRTPGMTDEEVIADVQRQLQAQGVDADVTFENGKIQIHRRGE